MRKVFRLALIFLAVIFLVFAQYLLVTPKAFAGTLTTTSLVELGSSGSSYTNPMIVSDNQFFGIGFKTVSAIASNVTIQVTFPAGFTIGATGSQTASSTDPVSGLACNNANGIFGTAYSTLSGLSASSSGQTITITTSSALSATTQYCVFDTYTSAITNPGSAGTDNVTIGTYNNGSLVDQQIIGVQVLSASCGTSQDCNSYTVSATINPTFSMSLSAFSDALGSLSSSAAVESTGVTTTISTNAASGWFVWASDANGGLTSATASHTINSVTGNTAFDFSTHTGADEYGLGVSANNTTAYQYTGGACTATHFCGAGLSKTVFYQVAHNGSAANGVTFVTHEIADISPTSPPGTDYSDTVTLIGCGSF